MYVCNNIYSICIVIYDIYIKLYIYIYNFIYVYNIVHIVYMIS